MITKVKPIIKAIILNKKLRALITLKNVKQLMILVNEAGPYLDHLERKGYIKGAWRNGKKIRLLKTLNQKIITKYNSQKVYTSNLQLNFF